MNVSICKIRYSQAVHKGTRKGEGKKERSQVLIFLLLVSVRRQAGIYLVGKKRKKERENAVRKQWTHTPSGRACGGVQQWQLNYRFLYCRGQKEGGNQLGLALPLHCQTDSTHRGIKVYCLKSLRCTVYTFETQGQRKIISFCILLLSEHISLSVCYPREPPSISS